MLLIFVLYVVRYSGFFLSASFHSGCRQGSLAKGKRRGSAEQMIQELAPESYLQEPDMTLENVRLR